VAIFNNAAQVWNHDFYWRSLKPQGGGKPSGEIGQQIEESFESFDKFKEEFAKTAVAQFGSGWAWLVSEGGKLRIIKTKDADDPLPNSNQRALLTIDVWSTHIISITRTGARTTSRR